MTPQSTLPTLLLMAALLSACSSGLESGGGAGDSEETADAIALISPLVGLYDLPDNWAGFPANEAFLEIQEPDEFGVAAALLFRTNTLNNCIEPRPSIGEVTKDPFDDRVFLDRLFEFDSSVLSRSGRNLVISLPRDVQDIDDDNDFDEPARLDAQRVDMMSSDLLFCP